MSEKYKGQSHLYEAHKGLQEFHGIRSVDSGKARGMELMTNPSREITTVACGVPKEGHAI